MPTPDRLMQLIARLQSNHSLAYGRRLLLRHVRASSGASLAVLFLLDKEQQIFTPLMHSGRLPASNIMPEHTQSVKRAVKRVPQGGLFSMAVDAKGLLRIPDLYSDPHALIEERSWGWPGGGVILSSVLLSSQVEEKRGVLALYFTPDSNDGQAPEWTDELEVELLVCSTLFSIYLSQQEDEEQAPETVKKRTRRQRVEALAESGLPADVYPRANWEKSSLADQKYSFDALSELYELGLSADTIMEREELYSPLLSHCARVVRAQWSSLLLYQLHNFIPVVTVGEQEMASRLALLLDEGEMERLAVRGPGETMTLLPVEQQPVLIVTLSYNCVLSGIIALAYYDEELLNEHRLLLSYMGHIAALLIHHHILHEERLQGELEQERERIMRDIHDGAVQRFVMVAHRLEFIQRLLEKQPQPLAQLQKTLASARENLDIGVRELRHSIVSIMPPPIESMGFPAALQQLIDEVVSNQEGLQISYESEGYMVPQELETPVYRFLQEALNNIYKHARATEVSLLFRTTPTLFIVEIRDNGVGFLPEPVLVQGRSENHHEQHFGLRSMRERVRKLGGSWEVQSRPGEGTMLRARFPLPSTEQPLTEREREVLKLLVEGQTNRDIAANLSISPETVKSHVHHITQKLQARDRTQAAVIAVKNGWL